VTTLTRREREEQEAEDYAACLRDGLRHDWAALNADIIDRFSLTALVRIKTRAWQLATERRP
jgi:hypothetical protein